MYNDATVKMESMEEGIVGSKFTNTIKESSNLAASSLDRNQECKIVFATILVVALMSIAAVFFARSIGKRQIRAKVWMEDGDVGN